YTSRLCHDTPSNPQLDRLGGQLAHELVDGKNDRFLRKRGVGVEELFGCVSSSFIVGILPERRSPFDDLKQAVRHGLGGSGVVQSAASPLTACKRFMLQEGRRKNKKARP